MAHLPRHKSILAYLTASGSADACASFKEGLGLADDFVDDVTLKKYEGLLEKKWTSVVRLQKKVGGATVIGFVLLHTYRFSDHGTGSQKLTTSSRT